MKGILSAVPSGLPAVYNLPPPPPGVSASLISSTHKYMEILVRKQNKYANSTLKEENLTPRVALVGAMLFLWRVQSNASFSWFYLDWFINKLPGPVTKSVFACGDRNISSDAC